MKAIGYRATGDSDVLVVEDIPVPSPGENEILVEVKASGMNPADPFVRELGLLQGADKLNVLGYDTAGVVQGVGEGVTKFSAGDEVYFMCDVTKNGSNAPYQVVHAAMVALKPRTLSFPEAASMPLTMLTAYELLFDRLNVPRDQPGNILLLGAAGGVGSALIQALRVETQLTVVATASRPETTQWVTDLGAHHVVNHRNKLSEQVVALDIGQLDYAIIMRGANEHCADLVEVMKPQSKIGLIDDPAGFDIFPLKLKSISLHWEFVFTKSMFSTPDLATQGETLERIAALVDEGKMRHTLTQNLGPLSLDALKAAHGDIRKLQHIGKAAFEGFA